MSSREVALQQVIDEGDALRLVHAGESVASSCDCGPQCDCRLDGFGLPATDAETLKQRGVPIRELAIVMLLLFSGLLALLL